MFGKTHEPSRVAATELGDILVSLFIGGVFNGKDHRPINAHFCGVAKYDFRIGHRIPRIGQIDISPREPGDAGVSMTIDYGDLAWRRRRGRRNRPFGRSCKLRQDAAEQESTARPQESSARSAKFLCHDAPSCRNYLLSKRTGFRAGIHSAGNSRFHFPTDWEHTPDRLWMQFPAGVSAPGTFRTVEAPCTANSTRR